MPCAIEGYYQFSVTPRNLVIYHYPLFGVIFMVILFIFIIQNYPSFFSKYYPKFKIRVIYPFIFNLGEF